MGNELTNEDGVLTVEELGMLVELVGRAPMTRAERLWVAWVMGRLRDWMVESRKGGEVEGAEGDGLTGGDLDNE